MREKSERVASHRLPVPPKDQVVLHTQSGLVTNSISLQSNSTLEKKPSLEETDAKGIAGRSGIVIPKGDL